MENLAPSISNFLLKNIPSLKPITEIKTVSGGNINSSFKISSKDHSVFLKLNSLDKAEMFQTEAKALSILDDKSSFKIPKVLLCDSVDEFSFLALEYLDLKHNASNPEGLGELLAEMHKNTSSNFGLDHNNFIGSLKQDNGETKDWIDFFICHRLEPQFKLAFNETLYSTSDQLKFSRFCHKLENYIPKEKPALVHGDLWSGNYSLDLNGNHVLYDPALYFGHREMDLAMMKLFGGFSPKVFEDYNLAFPLVEDWQERIPIHQLYPLLVHANLFGDSYAQEAKTIWQKYS